jgi:hypothetical protein
MFSITAARATGRMSSRRKRNTAKRKPRPATMRAKGVGSIAVSTRPDRCTTEKTHGTAMLASITALCRRRAAPAARPWRTTSALASTSAA